MSIAPRQLLSISVTSSCSVRSNVSLIEFSHIFIHLKYNTSCWLVAYFRIKVYLLKSNNYILQYVWRLWKGHKSDRPLIHLSVEGMQLYINYHYMNNCNMLWNRYFELGKVELLARQLPVTKKNFHAKTLLYANRLQ